MSLLRTVGEISARKRNAERELSEAIVKYREEIEGVQEQLDTAMVYAVDWGKHSWEEVALVAGYKNKAAIRDARKRVEKREAGVR